MALGDFWPSRPVDGTPTIVVRDVKAGAAASIKAGEPVIKDGGNAGYVKVAGANVTTSTGIYGIALSNSTDTAGADGKVYVILAADNVAFRGYAKTKASLAVAQKDTNVVIDLTSGTYTVDQSTTTNGVCNIKDYDTTAGWVEFVFKASALPNA